MSNEGFPGVSQFSLYTPREEWQKDVPAEHKLHNLICVMKSYCLYGILSIMPNHT